MNDFGELFGWIMSFFIMMLLIGFLLVVSDYNKRKTHEPLTIYKVETMVFNGTTSYQVFTKNTEKNKRVVMIRAYNNEKPNIGDVITLGNINYIFYEDLK